MEANDNFLNLVSEMDELRDLAEEAEIRLNEVLQDNEDLHEKVRFTESLNGSANIKLRDKMILLLNIIQEYDRVSPNLIAIASNKRKAGLIL